MRFKTKVRRKCEGQIFSVTQPVSYSFACHVSCKSEDSRGQTMFFHFRSTVVQLSAVDPCDYEHNDYRGDEILAQGDN